MIVQAEHYEAAKALCTTKNQIVVGYENGTTDWSCTAGRKAILWAADAATASSIAAAGASLRCLPADRSPGDFRDYDELLAWAREVVQPYESAAQEVLGDRLTSPEPSEPATPVAAPLQADSSSEPPDWPKKAEFGAPANFWDDVVIPEVPDEAMPPGILQFARDTADLIGVDFCQTAMNTIVVCASAVSATIKLQCLPESDWRETVRLWGAVVGNMSTKKGPAFDRCVAPLIALDDAFRERNNAALAKYELDVGDYEAALSAYRKEKGKNGAPPAAPERPALTRFWTDDVTKETVGKLCNQARQCIAILKDEIAGWIGSFSAYSSQKGVEKDRSDWLSFYEGKTRYIDRNTEGKSLHVKSFGGCILGGIQPGTISRIAVTSGGTVSMLEDGMLARFMIVVSKSATIGDERKPDHAAKLRYTQIIENVAKMRAHSLIQLSSEAQEYRRAKAKWIHETLTCGLAEPLMGAVGKYEGLHMRLTLLYHLIDCADPCREGGALEVAETYIPVETCTRAWQWIERVVFPHAAHFYTITLGAADNRDTLRSLAEFILARDVEILTTTELSNNWMPWRKGKVGGERKSIQNDLIARGQELNWFEPIGTSTTKFRVNPEVHKLFTKAKVEAKRKRATAAAKMLDTMPSARERQIGGDSPSSLKPPLTAP